MLCPRSVCQVAVLGNQPFGFGPCNKQSQEEAEKADGERLLLRGLVLLGEVVEEDEETGPGEQVHPGLLVLAHLLLLVLHGETKRSSSAIRENAQCEASEPCLRWRLVVRGWRGSPGRSRASSLACRRPGNHQKKKKKHITLDSV